MFPTLLAVLVSPGLAEPTPATEGARARGSCRLECKSQWHQIDLELKAGGKLPLSADLLRVFEARPGAKAGDSWKVEGPALEPLTRYLHGVAWESDPAQAEAYAKWQGNGPGMQKRRTEGSLAVTLTKEGDGRRLEFKGTLTVTDEGVMAGRFGPNWWRDVWTHELSGSISVAKDATGPSFELLDRFRVAGNHYTDPTSGGEPDTRTGTLRIDALAPKELPKELAVKVLSLIRQLGDASYRKREEATKALAAMGRDVVPLVRQHGLSSADAEVRLRARLVLEQLGED
jgi:hypothetical protein